MKTYIIFACTFLLGHSLLGQEIDSTKQIEEIKIVGTKTMNGVGYIADEKDQLIYSGKKTEVILIDSLLANKSINNTRQIIGRIPGLNIIETESGGFTANGVAFRGLNPYQSLETNTRQNGYNISADVYGYNESYYVPPMEAVKSITFVRGASSIAFGPQIGGMINYELKEGGTKPFEVTSSQTFGSFGLFSNFTSVGGTYKKLSYFGFTQYRDMKGWRENSNQNQLSGYGSLKYKFNEKTKIGIEYTGLRNTIQMPGGLTDSLFNENSKQSLRTRNWLQSPWNIVSANLEHKFSETTSISLKSAFLSSSRSLVWRNEDGGPAEKDTITPDLNYVAREVEHEYFKSTTNELRFITGYTLFNQKQSLSIGARYAYSFLKRQHGAEGTKGSNLDYTLTSDWGGQMNFYTTNVAGYIENNFRLGNKFSITPGIRFEYLKTIADGYDENEDENPATPYVVSDMKSFARTFVVGGVGLQYKLTKESNFYGNYSQSYRPITYSDFTPIGTTAKIDPNLKDATADNVDFGFRGKIKQYFNYDLGLFYINYKNKIGTVLKNDGTNDYAFRTNTGTAEHKGFESYLELIILNGLIKNKSFGKLSIYNSFAFVDARYISGEFAGNKVEYAPKRVERVGLNYAYKKLSFNFQYSYTSMSYGDASNAHFASDALIGDIPSYQVIDFSSAYRINKNIQVRFGVNNLLNANYFTLRTAEYPGPGIIPSIGRMFNGGLTVNF